MTRAYRSPNTPFSAQAATKPGNENSARIDAGPFISPTYLQLRAAFNPEALKGKPDAMRAPVPSTLAETHSKTRRPLFIDRALVR